MTIENSRTINHPGFLFQIAKPATPLHTLTFEAKQIKGEQGEESQLYIEQLNKIRDYLTENPKKIDEQWTFDVTPLHEAACAGLVKLTSLFLEFNPNRTLVNCLGETAETRARAMGLAETAELIAGKGKLM